MERVVFVDSNIWCYYFDEGSKEHRSVAQALEQQAQRTRLAVNTVVLMEASHYLIKHLGAIEGKRKAETLLSLPIDIIPFDYEAFRSSLNLLTRYTHSGIGGRDATILASMESRGIRALLTHDKAFKKVKDIDIIDPLE